MNTLNKILKSIQSVGNVNSNSTSINSETSEQIQETQCEGNLLSYDSDSLLLLINAEESEFLFI